LTKIVYNSSYGGFGLNREVRELYKKIADTDEVDEYSLKRTDPALVRAVEEAKNPGDLVIEELPEGTIYRIDEYDGLECVRTFDDHSWQIA
jgi:hypothetical protein